MNIQQHKKAVLVFTALSLLTISGFLVFKSFFSAEPQVATTTNKFLSAFMSKDQEAATELAIPELKDKVEDGTLNSEGVETIDKEDIKVKVASVTVNKEDQTANVGGTITMPDQDEKIIFVLLQKKVNGKWLVETYNIGLIIPELADL